MLRFGAKGNLISIGLAATFVAAMASFAEAQGGTGLRGEYYDNIDLSVPRGDAWTRR